MKSLLCKILLLFQIIKEYIAYNDSIPFNWTKTPKYCYFEDYLLTPHYRTLTSDYFPIRGCSSDERNKQYRSNEGINNITFQPKLDFFFPNEQYPPIDTDPPTYMTFRFYFTCSIFQNLLTEEDTYHLYLYFGRSEDYHDIPKISKRTGKAIEFLGNKALLSAKFKFYESELEKKVERNLTSKDFDFYDYEGEELNSTFDGYKLDFHFNEIELRYNERRNLDPKFCKNALYKYILLIRVYDLPRMKVQGQFQYRSSLIRTKDNYELKNAVYTVDTRNIFFQNISMFYNQRVNVTNEGDEPTGEDSGFWINTPCNQPQMATIMVDYYFFETIHKMQRFGYEFNDRFQLRIHTPYYRKTLTTNYSLFRSQWNETYEKPRVFIHPIYKYKEYCQKYKNCTKFNYEEWSTDPKWTKYIIDIKNEIVENEIRINFTELEKIYQADGFNRSKLVINVNNTMTPHITQITNGLWAELVDLVTDDWVMKTKTIMDEVHGYLDDNEADPYRNFYLTCEIPDNITKDDIDFVVKKYGILQTAHLWFRLDVFNKGITKMYPPRFNVVFKFPPEIIVTNKTFGYTYQYYRIPGSLKENWYALLKDFRKDGLRDGSFTNTTFDYKRNIINVSEIHPNFPNGDDTLFYTQTYEYLCDSSNISSCLQLEIKRQFLYYFYDLSIAFSKNGTRPIDITVYQIKYVPFHSKDQIHRGLHRWNPHHAGWKVSNIARYYDERYQMEYYGYYFEAYLDNYYFKPPGSNEYINVRGSTDARPFSGTNCVFGFAGGSSLRNKSCEFWNGLIPDQPFTNYARDIYEEHIAYRTLSDDDTFTIDTKSDVRADHLSFAVLDPFAGKFTGITFEGLYWFNVENYIKDGEPTCNEFYERPTICGNNIECLKPIYNVHEYPKEFFVKIKLPEGFSVNSTCVGKVLPCYWDSKATSRFVMYSLQDYLCYYINSTHIYAFNSIGQLGFCPDSGYFDIIIQIDGIYIHENTKVIKKGSGFLQFGFYETNFFVSEYPRNLEDDPMYYNKNVSIQISRTNMTNDGIGNFTLNVTATDWFNKDNLFRFDFSKLIKNAALTKMAYNGEIDDEKLIKLKLLEGFTTNNIIFDYYWNYLNLLPGTKVGPSFIIAPYLDYHMEHTFPWNVSFIKENETMVFEINITLENYRSFKPIDLEFFRSNLSYSIIFQYETFQFANNIPQYLMNLTVVPNSFYTNDRAVYTINFTTFMKRICEGDIFEFKTSWRTLYKNTKDPDEEGYYLNRIIFDKNITLNNINMTIYADPILNPDSLEVQYIKDIKILDKEEYLVAVYEGIIPIKMKKYIGFKTSDANTLRTEKDKTKFDIYFEIVPEVLIKKDDSLLIKFSEGVILPNYSECLIDAEKGLDNLNKEFKCEINKENNEIILYNGFRAIGETEFIFDDQKSNALVDQEIKFVLKDIQINRNDKDEADEIFSLEIKTESNGIITQKNDLPLIVHFECGYRCKTCDKENNNLCLSCIDEYPFYYKHNKECHKKCPTEQYYIQLDEDGNKECNLCNERCEACEGIADYCTKCIEPFLLENNSCVENCSEGNMPDYLLRKCYPISYLNEPNIIEKKIYVNVSIPQPYNVYIENNICSINNETETEEESEEVQNEREEKEEEFNNETNKIEEEKEIFNDIEYIEEENNDTKIKEEEKFEIYENDLIEEEKIIKNNPLIEEEKEEFNSLEEEMLNETDLIDNEKEELNSLEQEIMNETDIIEIEKEQLNSLEEEMIKETDIIEKEELNSLEEEIINETDIIEKKNEELNSLEEEMINQTDIIDKEKEELNSLEEEMINETDIIDKEKEELYSFGEEMTNETDITEKEQSNSLEEEIINETDIREKEKEELNLLEEEMINETDIIEKEELNSLEEEMINETDIIEKEQSNSLEEEMINETDIIEKEQSNSLEEEMINEADIIDNEKEELYSSEEEIINETDIIEKEKEEINSFEEEKIINENEKEDFNSLEEEEKNDTKVNEKEKEETKTSVLEEEDNEKKLEKELREELKEEIKDNKINEEEKEMEDIQIEEEINITNSIEKEEMKSFEEEMNDTKIIEYEEEIKSLEEENNISEIFERENEEINSVEEEKTISDIIEKEMEEKDNCSDVMKKEKEEINSIEEEINKTDIIEKEIEEMTSTNIIEYE